MERELWTELYLILRQTDPCVGVAGDYFTDGAIAAIQLWAAVHDRPTSWACDPANWAAVDPPFDLADQSTMSRRLRTPGVRGLLDAAERHYRDAGRPSLGLVKRLDAKPLPVGGHSTDPDAAWGRGVRADARGYKFHVVWGDAAVPAAWDVRPMSVGEPAAARRLLPAALGAGGGGYLLADGGYDSNPLHDLALAHGHQLVAPRKRPGGGWGHRRHSPGRRRSAALLEGGGRFGRGLAAARGAVERRFGNLTGFGGGLQPLPAWVRRPWRVRLWVQAKLLVNAARATILARRRELRDAA